MSAAMPHPPFDDRRQAELAKRNGKLALEALRRLGAGVVVCAADGRILLANPVAEKTLECSPLEGTPIGAVFASPEKLRKQARAADENAQLSHEGSEQVFGYKVSEGPEGELIILFRDITRQVRLRAERDRLMHLSTVGDVLPAVLHELRNPLAAVTSAIEVLVDTAAYEEPAELAQDLAGILNELRRMSLVFQGIGSVGRRLRSQRVARLGRAVREVVRVMAHRGSTKHIMVEADVEDPPPLPVDPAIFRAVVFNLVANAINASNRGDRVVVTMRYRNGVLTLAVEDNGSGMTPEVLESCTTPFYTTRANGSGLGLVICKEAIEDAGGTLGIVSAIGEGTVVTVSLPFDVYDGLDEE